MAKSPQQSKALYLSPLAADIEAEFGALRHIKGEGGPLSAARLDALRIALEQAAQNLPKALHRGFHLNCTERLKSHFGCDYREIAESQFQEAVAVIGQQITEARHRVDKLAIELPRAENRRWRVTFFDLTG
jgi:hypothetical protein